MGGYRTVGGCALAPPTCYGTAAGEALNTTSFLTLPLNLPYGILRPLRSPIFCSLL
jgi:hypothetical protein